MPARTRHKNYNRVEDSYDTRIPLHNEEAFQHGFSFKAKYIGTLVVPRPTGRMEIVVAMRKIRYDFKAKQIKKRKVNVSISVDGVKTVLRKKKKKDWNWDEKSLLIMQDPVYRIFYVSHDSHDLKIWSYIARDSNSNKFRCNVFKSTKKSQAMRIVRTIGQAFEVCHKFQNTSSVIASEQRNSEVGGKQKVNGRKDQGKTAEEVSNIRKTEVEETDIDAVDLDETSHTLSVDVRRGVTDLDAIQKEESSHSSLRSPACSGKSAPRNDLVTRLSENMATSACHQLKLMQQKVTHAEQQAKVAVTQVQLLKDQLAAESTARIEFQARNHQLMLQNRELITQMSQMVSALKEYEDGGRPGHSSSSARVGNSAKYQRDISNGNLSVVDEEISAPSPLFLSSYSALHSLEKPSRQRPLRIGGAEMSQTDFFQTETPAAQMDNLIAESSLFENSNTALPLYGLASSNLSSNCNKQQDFMGLDSVSVVANDHTNTPHQNIPLQINGRIETSDSSSSSSSEDEEDSTQNSSSTITFQQTPQKLPMERSPVSRGLAKNVGDLLTFNDTRNTSVWTSGLKTPTSSSSLQNQAISNTFSSSSLFSTTVSSTSIMNGYTLSPISFHSENNPSMDTASPRQQVDKTSCNPIRWRRLSPTVNSSNSNQQEIPRLHPPPASRGRNLTKLNASSSNQTADMSDTSTSLYSVTEFSFPTPESQNQSKLEQIGMNQFDPVTSAVQTLDSSDIANNLHQQQTFSSPVRVPPAKQKLFVLDPEEHERRLRYEPLQKIQASQWREKFSTDHKNPQPSAVVSMKKISPNKKKRDITPPVQVHNDPDISISSILDRADVSVDISANDICGCDAGKTHPFQTRDQNKTSFCEDDEDDPLSVLEELNSPSRQSPDASGEVDSNFVPTSMNSLDAKEVSSSSPIKTPPKTLSLPVDHLASSSTSLNDKTPVLKPLLSPVTSKQKSEDVFAPESTSEDHDLFTSSNGSTIHPTTNDFLNEQEKSCFPTMTSSSI